MENPIFGIISEGVTDQAVLETLLYGFFNDPDLVVNPLQPLRDATDKTQGFGSWSLIFEYCQSERFKQAFEDNDFIIIQIDTDLCSQEPFGIDAKRSEESTEDFIKRVQTRFVELFQNKWGNDFCVLYFHRILFAVAVNSIECWLLPIHLNNDKQKNKEVGCKTTLERELKRGIPKEYKIYLSLAKPYLRNKTFQNEYQKNDSLRYFVDKEINCKVTYWQAF